MGIFKKIIFVFLLLFMTTNLFAKAAEYVVWVDGLRLREAPSGDSKVVTSLKKYDEVTAVGEIRYDDYEAVLSDTKFFGGWIKVKTKQNHVGWAYKPALSNIVIINGLKFYIIKSDLFIIQEKTEIVLKKNPIKAKKNAIFNDIAVYSSGNAIVIGVRQKNDMDSVPPPLDGIYDHYIVYHTKRNVFSQQISDYPRFCGFSKSGDYAMFDRGPHDTPALIYSVANLRQVHEFTPLEGASWKNNSVEYEEAAGSKYPGLPDLSRGKIYVKSCIWDNMNVNVIKVYEKSQ